MTADAKYREDQGADQGESEAELSPDDRGRLHPGGVRPPVYPHGQQAEEILPHQGRKLINKYSVWNRFPAFYF